MFVVRVPVMVANYLRCPQNAVEDYRILVTSMWKLLGIGELPANWKSLASFIPGTEVSKQSLSDVLDSGRELDFRSLVQLSPIDALQRFREVIEKCYRDTDAVLLRLAGLPELDRLLEILLNRTRDGESTVYAAIQAVERNFEEFATEVDVRTIQAADEDRLKKDGGMGSSKQRRTSGSTQSTRVSAVAKQHERVLEIVAEWRKHHDRPGGYLFSPMTQSQMETSTGIPRRTLARTVKELFGIMEKRCNAGWKLYEHKSQKPDEFLMWLDLISRPSASLSLISSRPSAATGGMQCDSCGDAADELYERREKKVCSAC